MQPHAQLAVNSSARPTQVKWHHVYFLLAAFAVFTVSFSLVMNHHLITTHKRAVAGNFLWVGRLQLCDNLGKDAAEVAAAANNALKSHDADAASLNMRTALSRFNEKWDTLRDEIQRNVPPKDGAQLLPHCATVRKEISDIVETDESIFSLVRARKFDEARAQGVALSQEYNEVLRELDGFRVDLRALRKLYLEAQTAEASALAKYEWWLGGLILLMVASITIYGMKLKRHMSAAEKQLEAANQRLETELAERKRSEEERDRFFTLSLDMLCIANSDGYFKRVNSAFTETLGWSAEELLRKPFLDFVHPDDRTATLREVERQVVAGEKVLHFDNRYQHKDGSWHVLWWRSVPQPGGFMYATARDVTEQKQMEEATRKLHEDVKQTAVQLQAANKELEAFSYSVSHDLRSPLRHINGYVDLLQKNSASTLNEKGQRYLKMISESAKQMGTLIDDLLSFSRMGRAELRKTPLSLNKLVKEVVEDSQQEARDREVVWSVGSLPEVQADPSMLRLLLVNLVSNALKYSRTRKPARIEISCQSQNGDTVFSIHDNGVGFDMQYADKLFGVFQRLHSPNEFEGTGIGLANVRRIIQRHGGKAWAEGTVNGGATFYFSLPKHRKDET